ncbi:MAG: YdcF family protein [Rickettsia endosymbiont of Argas persicus]
MMKKIFLTIFIIFAIWLSGFIYYLYLINSYKPSSNSANAIVVFAGGGHKIETGIALLKAGYAPILFITGIETSEQLKNLLKENNILEQQVIIAPNQIMSEEDYIKKVTDFILKYNLTSVLVVAYNYDMPSIVNNITKNVSYSNNLYIVPYPVPVKQNYKMLIKHYNKYLLSL